MQSAPTTQPIPQNAASYFVSLPWWAQLIIGSILVGLSASILAANLRAAFPAQRTGWERVMHYLYPSGLGGSFAILAPYLFGGIDVAIRGMMGIVLPYIWGPLYDGLKKKYLGEMGSVLPSSQDLVKVNPPTPATEGNKS